MKKYSILLADDDPLITIGTWDDLPFPFLNPPRVIFRFLGCHQMPLWPAL